MIDHRALGLECMKLGFFGSFFEKDNPRARVLKGLIGEDRIKGLDDSLRERASSVLPPSLMKSQDSPDGEPQTPDKETSSVEQQDRATSDDIPSDPTPPEAMPTPAAFAENPGEFGPPKKMPDMSALDAIQSTPNAARSFPELRQPAATQDLEIPATKMSNLHMHPENDNFKPQQGAALYGTDMKSEPEDAVKDRDPEEAAEPRRQGEPGELLAMKLGDWRGLVGCRGGVR